MEVEIRRQTEMTGVFRGVAGLLHGPQQERVDHVLGGGAVRLRQHAGKPGRVDRRLGQLQAHGPGRLGEGLELGQVRVLVDTVEDRAPCPGQGLGHRLVGGEHEVLDQQVRLVARPQVQLGHLIAVEAHLGLGEVEFQAAALNPPLLEQGRQVPGVVEHGRQPGMGPTDLGVTQVGELVHGGVGEPSVAADQAAAVALADATTVGVEAEDGGESGPILVRHQAAQVVGQSLGQHGQHPVGQVGARAAAVGLPVDGRAHGHVVTDVGDGHVQGVACLGPLDTDRVVEIAGRLAVDGHVGHVAQVEPAVQSVRRIERRRLGHDLGREALLQAEAEHGHADLHGGALRVAQNLDDPAGGSLTVGAVVEDIRHHRTVVGGIQGVAATDAHRVGQPLVVRGQGAAAAGEGEDAAQPGDGAAEHLHHPPLPPAALHAGDGDEHGVAVTGPAQVQGSDEHVLAALGLVLDHGKAEPLGGDIQGRAQPLGRGRQGEMPPLLVQLLPLCEPHQGLAQFRQLPGYELQGREDLGGGERFRPFGKERQDQGLERGVGQTAARQGRRPVMVFFPRGLAPPARSSCHSAPVVGVDSLFLVAAARAADGGTIPPWLAG